MSLDIEIKISGDLAYKADLHVELFFDEATLQKELANQASKFASVAVACARAKALRDRIEADLETLESKVSLAIRKKVTEDKLTEAAIKALIRTHSAVLKKLSQYLESKHTVSLLEAAVDAFKHRKDALVSYSANLREERNADMSNMERRLYETGLGEKPKTNRR